MCVLLIIVFLTLNVGKSGGAIKPVVTFTPNWGNILFYDNVTLTCDVPSTVPEEPRIYFWCRNNTQIDRHQQTLHIISSSVQQDRGDYQCRTNGGDISDPVFLNVTQAYVILQRPPPAIYEGDPLTLRCHHLKDFNAVNTKFYKDDNEIQPSNTNSEYHIHKVDVNMSGLYKCTKQLQRHNDPTAHEHSDIFRISVKELFSPPEIKVTPYRVIEGDNMTVRCDTRLDPLRATTELLFTFYKDGRSVREFNVSDTYKVKSAQLEDSGNYTCDVRTAYDTVRKMSDRLHIQIWQLHGANLSVPIIAAAVIGSLVVIMVSAVFAWKCRSRSSRRFTHEAPHQAMTAAVNAADPDPRDVCYTYLDISRLPKGTTIRHDELTVTYATVNNANL